ncbi:MAG TPA: hypothetical protein VF292_02785 [Rhodanobacteraceae bacterium]
MQAYDWFDPSAWPLKLRVKPVSCSANTHPGLVDVEVVAAACGWPAGRRATARIADLVPAGDPDHDTGLKVNLRVEHARRGTVQTARPLTEVPLRIKTRGKARYAVLFSGHWLNLHGADAARLWFDRPVRTGDNIVASI